MHECAVSPYTPRPKTSSLNAFVVSNEPGNFDSARGIGRQMMLSIWYFEPISFACHASSQAKLCKFWVSGNVKVIGPDIQHQNFEFLRLQNMPNCGKDGFRTSNGSTPNAYSLVSCVLEIQRQTSLMHVARHGPDKAVSCHGSACCWSTM